MTDTATAMMNRAHGLFALALAGVDFTEAETRIIDAAVAAGVSGALDWCRDHGIDIPEETDDD